MIVASTSRKKTSLWSLRGSEGTMRRDPPGSQRAGNREGPPIGGPRQDRQPACPAVAIHPPLTISIASALDQQLIFRPIPGLGQGEYADSRAVPSLVLSAARWPRAWGLRHECGTSCIGTRAAYTPSGRLRAASGEVGEPAQRLAVAYVDAGHLYRLRD
jgi:hypothetical protein